jgi:hypothetical protein
MMYGVLVSEGHGLIVAELEFWRPRLGLFRPVVALWARSNGISTGPKAEEDDERVP